MVGTSIYRAPASFRRLLSSVGDIEATPPSGPSKQPPTNFCFIQIDGSDVLPVCSARYARMGTELSPCVSIGIYSYFAPALSNTASAFLVNGDMDDPKTTRGWDASVESIFALIASLSYSPAAFFHSHNLRSFKGLLETLTVSVFTACIIHSMYKSCPIASNESNETAFFSGIEVDIASIKSFSPSRSSPSAVCAIGLEAPSTSIDLIASRRLC
mmetsp:Transcript_102/g.227  ORF Transcript_102/g.227 Transcript_102/m.227 type:complete len:214 (+) Transcript_102:213-854(+)